MEFPQTTSTDYNLWVQQSLNSRMESKGANIFLCLSNKALQIVGRNRGKSQAELLHAIIIHKHHIVVILQATGNKRWPEPR